VAAKLLVEQIDEGKSVQAGDSRDFERLGHDKSIVAQHQNILNSVASADHYLTEPALLLGVTVQ